MAGRQASIGQPIVYGVMDKSSLKNFRTFALTEGAAVREVRGFGRAASVPILTKAPSLLFYIAARSSGAPSAPHNSGCMKASWRQYNSRLA